MHKADKELSEVAARWEEIKKGTSQVQHGVLHYFHKIVTCAKSQYIPSCLMLAELQGCRSLVSFATLFCDALYSFPCLISVRDAGQE